MVARRATARGRPRHAVRPLHRRGRHRRLPEGLRAAWRQVRLSHPAGRRDAYPAGARRRAGRQADGKENRGLAPRPCREAGARPHQARPQTEPPQGRQERRRRSQAARHRKPNPDGPESGAQPRLEIRARRERRRLAPREAVPGGRNGARALSLRGRMRAAGQRLRAGIPQSCPRRVADGLPLLRIDHDARCGLQRRCGRGHRPRRARRASRATSC